MCIVRQIVTGQIAGRSIKTVGFKDVCTGLKIFFMNTTNNVWLRQYQQVIHAFEIDVPASESFTVIISIFKTVALNHCAHSTIKQQNALL
ncbi:hypothetical protein BMS3Bbin11_00427 [bacterium BMS3Bbin11]|nr:hypothetical protein BMS3Bbin11_00427 [bacterium BMS3Bbin11]